MSATVETSLTMMQTEPNKLSTTATIEIPKAKDGEDLVYLEPINAVNFGENAKGEFHENTGPHTDKMGVYGSKENEQVELTNHNSAASSDVGASDGGLQRIESGDYVTIEGVAQQLPGNNSSTATPTTATTWYRPTRTTSAA